MSNKDKRPPLAMGQLTARDDGGMTIVGGQPRDDGGGKTRNIPVGLERVLFTAAADHTFRESLRSDRDEALAELGVELRDSERAMLRLIPEEQLQAIIDGLDVSRGNLARRGFLRSVAAVSLTVAAGEALVGCSDDGESPYVDAGVRVDDGQPVGMDSTGIRPDWVPITDNGPGVDAGISPDTVQIVDKGPTGDMGIRPPQPDSVPIGDGHPGLDSAGIRPKD